MALSSLLLFAVACGDGPGDDPSVVDNDGDGSPASEDCDDENATIYPGADELCDGLDNNCDEEIDENPVDAEHYFQDADGDGYGNAALSQNSCEMPSGYVENFLDCDDTDSALHLLQTWYLDEDGDGYGSETDSGEYCAQLSGTVGNGEDCDDGDGAVNPAADEVCDGVDNDCNEETTEEGLVTWIDSGGQVYDQTSVFQVGTPEGPVQSIESLDGTLNFCAGNWWVDLVLQADVSIRGFPGSGEVALDGGDEDRTVVTVDVEASDVSLEGLTIQNGLNYYGGGIYCEGYEGEEENKLTLQDVVLRDNEAEGSGGGIAMIWCPATIRQGEISDNTAGDSGGGIYAYKSDLNLTETWVLNNESENGGGGAWIEESILICDPSAGSGGFHENYARDVGGGVVVSEGTTLISEGCDWGVDETDNTPDDVALWNLGVSFSGYEEDADFTCSESNCSQSNNTQ